MVGQETLALNRAHGVEHAPVGHALRAKLVLNHRPARGSEVGVGGLRTHCCYMPVTHLGIKPVLSRAQGVAEGAALTEHICSRQPPLVEREARPGDARTWGRASS